MTPETVVRALRGEQYETMLQRERFAREDRIMAQVAALEVDARARNRAKLETIKAARGAT